MLPKRIAATSATSASTSTPSAASQNAKNNGKRAHSMIEKNMHEDKDADYDNADPFAFMSPTPPSATSSQQQTDVTTTVRAPITSTLTPFTLKSTVPLTSTQRTLTAAAASSSSSSQSAKKKQKLSSTQQSKGSSANDNRVSSSSQPDDNNDDAAMMTTAAASSESIPLTAAAAASSTSTSTSSSSAFQSHQSSMSDHFNRDRLRQASLTPAQRLLQSKRSALRSSDVCLRCDTWLGDGITMEMHQRVCPKHPPPKEFTALSISKLVGATSHITQYTQSYNATAWRGSLLIRVTHTHFLTLTKKDRMKVTSTIEWLESMLNGGEGRRRQQQQETFDREDDEGSDEEEEAKEEEKHQLRENQELYMYLLPRGTTSYILTCAVLITSGVHLRTAGRQFIRNMKSIPVSQTKKQPKQQRISFFGKSVSNEKKEEEKISGPSAASPSAPSASSTTSSPSPTLAPLFGVDRIAVHANYRYAATAAAAAATADAPSTSLVHHVLSSILALRWTSIMKATAAAATSSAAVTSSNTTPSTTLLPYSRVAFSSPTPAGLKLAARFTGTPAFLTYDFV